MILEWVKFYFNISQSKNTKKYFIRFYVFRFTFPFYPGEEIFRAIQIFAET